MLGIITLALQTMAGLNSLQKGQGAKKGDRKKVEDQVESTVVFLISTVYTLLESIRRLLNLAETAKEMYNDKNEEENDPEAMLENIQDDVNIWQEEGNNLRMETNPSENSLGILAGSLNKLVEVLTSDTQYGYTFFFSYN